MKTRQSADNTKITDLDKFILKENRESYMGERELPCFVSRGTVVDGENHE